MHLQCFQWRKISLTVIQGSRRKLLPFLLKVKHEEWISFLNEWIKLELQQFISHGLIVYVCFMKGSTEETVDQMVKSLLNVRLSEKDGKLVSILDLPGDVLIIPQATLGGNMKGKCMQYHKNIAKEDGLHLYLRFTSVCCDIIQQNSKDSQGSNIVKNGTYGNRQVLSTITNGPFTHLLEFM